MARIARLVVDAMLDLGWGRVRGCAPPLAAGAEVVLV